MKENSIIMFSQGTSRKEEDKIICCLIKEKIIGENLILPKKVDSTSILFSLVNRHFFWSQESRELEERNKDF